MAWGQTRQIRHVFADEAATEITLELSRCMRTPSSTPAMITAGNDDASSALTAWLSTLSEDDHRRQHRRRREGVGC